MSSIIAVGPREQDFLYTNGFFDGSVTLYGSNKNGNHSYCNEKKIRINHNVFSQDQADFVERKLLKYIEEDPGVRFMSYDPNQAYGCSREIISRTLCLNSKPLMEKVNYKISFRNWAKELCPVHHSDTLPGRECTYDNLLKHYDGRRAFVVQANFACGGEGTFVLNESNHKVTESSFHPSENYLVSVYEEQNIPINIHAIIYEKEILLFPVSVQIMRLHFNKLLYHGADFITADQIDKNVLQQFKNYVLSICKKLQAEGYRGITGIDGMIVDGQARILEMNNRFQGSTLLLNYALHDYGLPSMQELNYASFEEAHSAICIENLKVPYSCYTYTADKAGNIVPGHKRHFAKDPNFVECLSDDLHYDWPIAPNASLEKVIFRTNISTVTSDGSIALHPNVPDLEDDWYVKIVEEKNLLYLKVSLLNRGITVSPDAEKYLRENGGVREGVYNAVDIYLNDIIVNSAVRVKFTALSPFSLHVKNSKLFVFCCGREVCPAEVQKADMLGENLTKSGGKVKDICILATDRIRVQHSCNCYFKKSGTGCNFCEVEDHDFSFGFDDITQAIDYYLDSDYPFRHFLIGGRSDLPDREPGEIIRIAQYIRQRGDWPIYVMCVPPPDFNVLKSFYDAGVTELALNIEIWDRALAKRWMPAKGSIPREYYLDALRYSVELWGNTGDVRSSFIVGLEPQESLFEGIDAVCRLGAAPILSVFRPIPGTPGEDVSPPSDESLLQVYYTANSISNRYGLTLGPKCVSCQNNTLSMPKWYIQKRG